MSYLKSVVWFLAVIVIFTCGAPCSAAQDTTQPAKPSNAIRTASDTTSDASVDSSAIALDTTPPDVCITSPATLITDSCASSSISLSGQASDDLGIATVQWFCNGASGSCSGIENWTADSIPLLGGANLITVAATDLAGNIGADSVIVVYAPPITIKIVVLSTKVAPQQVVPVSVVYTNVGTADVNNVTVSAQVPSGMDYLSGSAEVSGGVWNAATNTVSWSIPTIPAQQSGTQAFQATVK